MGKRSYHQFCGVARALDLVGERWTLLIARDLLLGPRRYSELLSGLPGITTNLLARRLKDMREDGLIEKVQLDHKVAAYALTPLGLELEPVVLSLGRFGERWLREPRPDDRLDVSWAMVSLRRRYVGTLSGALGLAIAAPEVKRFQVRFGPEGVDTRLGSPWDVRTTARFGLPALRGLFFGGASASALEASGALVVEGERGSWEAFVEGFGIAP